MILIDYDRDEREREREREIAQTEEIIELLKNVSSLVQQNE